MSEISGAFSTRVLGSVLICREYSCLLLPTPTLRRPLFALLSLSAYHSSLLCSLGTPVQGDFLLLEKRSSQGGAGAWGLPKAPSPQGAAGTPGCDPLGTVVPRGLACGGGEIRSGVLGARRGVFHGTGFSFLVCAHTEHAAFFHLTFAPPSPVNPLPYTVSYPHASSELCANVDARARTHSG